MIYLTIQFHPQWKKSDFQTSWFLSFTNTGNQKSFEIDFQKPIDDLKNENLA